MDMDIPGQVVVCQVRGELEEVLLLAYFVRLLFMGGLCILLQVRIILCLKPPPDIDEVRVIDGGPDPGADVPVLHHPLFKESYVDDLPDQGTGEGPQAECADALLNEPGYLLGRLLAGALVPVEGLDQFRLAEDLVHDAVPVPVHDMPVRCPDRGHLGNKDPFKGGLQALSPCHQDTPARSRTRSSTSASPEKRSREVRNPAGPRSTGASFTKTPCTRSSVMDAAVDMSLSVYAMFMRSRKRFSISQFGQYSSV